MIKAVSYAEVQSALAQLVERKESITLSSLRAALGHRGSMSTLSKHLQRWKQEQALTEIPPGPINPAPEPILAAVQGVWQKIFEKGQQELLQQQEAFDAQRLEFQQSLETAKKQAEQALFEAAEFRQKNQAISARSAELEQQIIEFQHQTQLAQQRALQAEQTSIELKTLLTQTVKELQEYQAQSIEQQQKEKITREIEKEQLKKEFQQLLQQEQQRAISQQAQWQASYLEIQHRCAQAELLVSQIPSLKELQQTLYEQQRLLEQQAASKEDLQNIKKSLKQLIRPYQTVSFTNLKGYC